MADGTSSPMPSRPASPPAVYVKYWGVTGSYSDPWRPTTTRDWLTTVLITLRERGLLNSLQDQHLGSEQVQSLLTANLSPTLLAGPRRQTTCIEIRTPEQLFLVDAGSGLVDFDIRSAREDWPDLPAECHLLLTHGHWDHLLGLPFYSGFFAVEQCFTVWAHERVLTLLRMMFERDSTLGETLIPTNFEQLRALRELKPIEANQSHWVGKSHMATLALNHPAGSLGYRFEHEDRIIVIATDHELTGGRVNAALIDFARDADLLYLDAQYTEAEYLGRVGIGNEPPKSRAGWGHSTIEAAVTLGIAAGVKHLHLGHHDPRRTDSELLQLEEQAKALGTKLLKQQGRCSEDCHVQLACAGQTQHL